MNIQWWPRARAALSNILPRSEAEAIDRAVQEWARSGAGYVIHRDGEYRLLVGAHLVAFFVEGDTLHVDDLRRT
jgi:hypothetical protein